MSHDMNIVYCKCLKAKLEFYFSLMSYNIVKEEQKMIEIDAGKPHYASSGEPIFLSFFFNLTLWSSDQTNLKCNNWGSLSELTHLVPSGATK